MGDAIKTFSLNNDQKVTLGNLSGLAAIVLLPLFLGMALLNAPEYNGLTQTISKLGVTENGWLFFVLGTAISGGLLVIYYRFYLYEILNRGKNTQLGSLFGIISGLMLIGVGLFQDKEDFILRTTHFVFSGLFFGSMGLSIYHLSRFLRTSSYLWGKNLGLLGYIVCVGAILHFFFSFLKGNITVGNVEFSIAVVWQKVTVSGYVIWSVLLQFYLEKAGRRTHSRN